MERWSLDYAPEHNTYCLKRHEVSARTLRTMPNRHDLIADYHYARRLLHARRQADIFSAAQHSGERLSLAIDSRIF